MKNIHVGFLMSYDYEKLKNSIPPVYNDADSIFIAIDKDYRTWSGQKFEVEASFFEWLTIFDIEKKIILYSDDFYIPELSPIENDTRERYMLSLKMGVGNWLVQIDADEIFIDFEKFIKTLRKYDSYLINPEKHPIQISGYLINIYKYLDEGLLYIDKPTKVMLATNYPNYKVARKTKERIIYTDNILLHECLSRTEDELRYKFANWGHSLEINDSFFDKWKSANRDNYKEFRDVFYLNPKAWKRLGYLPSKDFNEMKEYIKNAENLKVSDFKLISKNFGQWFKHLQIKKINYKPKFEKYF
ncbi:hypothetical protein [Flavobacterium myungsuense]|uniref:Glycosyl transferase family 2 n=2 Tax=Flavobacterium myungsuense TaxID=651823 RepID=A0ABW3J0I5_9FLAO